MNFVKYWLFYLKREYQDDYPMSSDLYAYTDSKNLAKLFMETRDMSKFIIKKEEMSTNEIHNLAEFENFGVLELHEYKTKEYGHGSNTMNGSIVITRGEKTFSINHGYSLQYDELLKYAWINPFIFKDEYVDALHTISFTDAYNLITSGKDDMHEKVTFDFLNMFIDLYGTLLLK